MLLLLISVNITKSNSLPDNMAISLGTKGTMDVRREEKSISTKWKIKPRKNT